MGGIFAVSAQTKLFASIKIDDIAKYAVAVAFVTVSEFYGSSKLNQINTYVPSGADKVMNIITAFVSGKNAILFCTFFSAKLVFC